MLVPPYSQKQSKKSASNPTPGWKTNWMAGRKDFSPCWNCILSSVPQRLSLWQEFPCGLQCFSFCISSSSNLFQFWHPPSYGSALTCSDSRIIPLLSSSKRFHWTFQLAPVSVPILGADFLRHHHLLLDVAGGPLFEPSDPLPPGESLSTASEWQEFPLRANLLSTPQAIKDLLHKFSNVVYSDRFPTSEPSNDICHHILTNPGLLVFAIPHRLDPEKLASTQAELVLSTVPIHPGAPLCTCLRRKMVVGALAEIIAV